MALIIGKLKCYFCGKKTGFFHAVHQYGIYGELGKRIFYHPECLEMIEVDPERFGHILANRALHIGELKTQNLNINKELEANLNKKVEQLHLNHFERMMPKKL